MSKKPDHPPEPQVAKRLHTQADLDALRRSRRAVELVRRFDVASTTLTLVANGVREVSEALQ